MHLFCYGHVFRLAGTRGSTRAQRTLFGQQLVKTFASGAQSGVAVEGDSGTLLTRREPDKSSQDRVRVDGRFVARQLPQQPSQEAGQQLQRPSWLPETAPLVPPISQHQLDALADLLQGARNVVVLTGAGCSTESAIPDYRGPSGAYSTGFKPITHQQFMGSAERRSQYWARSYAGWHEFVDVEPNPAHEGLARLQRLGWVGPIMTQNVDRLHQKGGAHDVVEMHGTTHRVVCMNCERIMDRQIFQDQLSELNPGAYEAVERMVSTIRRNRQAAREARQRGMTPDGVQRPKFDAEVQKTGGPKEAEEAVVRRPDGDVEIPVRRPDGDVELRTAGTSFIVPPCAVCGGILKPYVVFFGDQLPKDRSARCLELAGEADAMLVVGSSLMVYSAFRLAKATKAAGSPLALCVVGPTRADDMADLKVEALAGEAMTRLASHPSLLVPRPV